MPQKTVTTTYDVVVDDEDHHSIWENGRPLPDGWRTQGFSGAREDCVRHIDEVWTQLRSPEDLTHLRKGTPQ
ncbi:MbtH family NRPS accessory protein [Streptomyces sp. NPDC057474]|uniref:MbtH family NRPS accessory protein n=1 Tax=Streptomyces sp. NPDC057474 TaxID=3346144 RepID=UPI00369121C2